mgnify:FL=1|jgi:hypothetical protein
MNHFNTATSTKPDNAPVQLNNRHRPRANGTDYGKSSGYAANRQYANTTTAASRVRVR